MKKLFITVCLAFYIYSGLLIYETLLRLKQSHIDQNNRKPSFITQFLHPYYFFAFPRNREVLNAIKTDSDSVDSNGYRGKGPKQKDHRELAFLLGGSSAFGIGARSNDLAIAGTLNRIQNKYFFVNAGVPSWNSFQELLKFLKDIKKEKPSLIVHFNGFNDLAIAQGWSDTDLPPDTPESFRVLEKWVEDIRDSSVSPTLHWRHAMAPIVGALKLSRLRGEEMSFESETHPSFNFLPERLTRKELARRTASAYLENMNLISDMCRAQKVKFKVFFQPYVYANLDPSTLNLSEHESEFIRLFQEYRQNILWQNVDYLVDLSNSSFKLDKNGGEDLFIDTVHFNEAGYAKIAEIISSRL